MIPGIAPSIVGPRIRKTWLGAAASSDSGSTISFGNFVAPKGGLLVALLTVHGADSRTMSSVSIGGTNGTLDATHGASSTRKAAIASRVVAAGTHAVTATLSGANGSSPRSYCGCWLLENYRSATPTFAQFSYNGTGNLSIGATHDIPYGAVLLYQVNEISAVDPTWTAALLDGSVTGGIGRGHWASRIGAGSKTGHVETATFASGATHLLMNAAVWA